MIRPIVRRAAAVALVAALLLAIMLWGTARLRRSWAPDPQAIAAASLDGLREQSRLTTLVASYVGVVTSTQSRFGLSARKTLILPGTVRYEIDLAALSPKDLAWHADTRTLDIVLPPVTVTPPAIDLARMQEYDGGGLLMRLTDAGAALDASNRRAGQAELLRQARQPVPMSLARDASRRAVERAFALPLRAAGLDATVRARFADEPGFPERNAEQVDRSRSLTEVYGNSGSVVPSK